MKNFRCFDELAISDIARVNLIAGENNVGKTALLEALFINKCSPELILSINRQRGIEVKEINLTYWIEILLNSIFKNFDTSKEIKLESEYEKEGHSSTIMRVIDPRKIKTNKTVLPALDKPEDYLLSSAISNAVELEYKDKTRGDFKYYIFATKAGIKIEPDFPA
ncbi:MAG: AAA family ATPase, partial [bacterium]